MQDHLKAEHSKREVVQHPLTSIAAHSDLDAARGPRSENRTTQVEARTRDASPRMGGFVRLRVLGEGNPMSARVSQWARLLNMRAIIAMFLLFSLTAPLAGRSE